MVSFNQTHLKISPERLKGHLLKDLSLFSDLRGRQCNFEVGVEDMESPRRTDRQPFVVAQGFVFGL